MLDLRPRPGAGACLPVAFEANDVVSRLKIAGGRKQVGDALLFA